MPAPQVAIPAKCSVLIVGGGPAGSFAACVLAREGLDVVLLEADVFPRYHIGETMLPAMRHLLRFIDADAKFDNHGFIRKTGSAFKLHKDKREGYTDFIAVGGPENYTWNLVRSESDSILFDHAKECGAKVFDNVKVNSLMFESSSESDPAEQKNQRPISASYTRKSDSSTGEIAFDYIIDATGRAGLLTTKYLKNRIYNNTLKNVATWSYWSGVERYARGTSRENTPLTEALTDESGWVWYIPLHTGHSIGVVIDQESYARKKSASQSTHDFYLSQLKLAPTISALIGTEGKLITQDDGSASIKSASDYSYSSTAYSMPYARVAGDAGCFIDPFFSSGVHLAMMGGFSAAISICASLRGEFGEEEAARWHSKRVAASYMWFLLVVLGAYKQIRAQDDPVLSDIDEDNFDRAFAFLTPVIQGSMDVQNRLSSDERERTLELCSKIFGSWHPDEREALLNKLNTLDPGPNFSSVSSEKLRHRDVIINSFASELLTSSDKQTQETLTQPLTEDEKGTLENAQARKLIKIENTLNISSFVTDVIDGKIPRVERGGLGLQIAVN